MWVPNWLKPKCIYLPRLKLKLFSQPLDGGLQILQAVVGLFVMLFKLLHLAAAFLQLVMEGFIFFLGLIHLAVDAAEFVNLDVLLLRGLLKVLVRLSDENKKKIKCK